MHISDIQTLMQFATEDSQPATLEGTRYRKQLAKYGEWVNPDFPWFSDSPMMTLDDAWGEKIVENFNNNVLGSKVPVPLNHTDDVKENTGEVLSVESVPGDGLYGILDIKDQPTVSKIDDGIIFDVSISFAWDFVRTDDNKHYGPTLVHVALVNTPYLVGMGGFEKLNATLSKSMYDVARLPQTVIMLSKTKMKELSAMGNATVKNDRDFDVTVKYVDGEVEKETVVKAGEELSVPESQAETVLSQIADATNDTQDDTATVQDDADNTGGETAEAELARLRTENSMLKLSAAYDQLLSEGKVTPAQKDKIMGLAKLNSNTELSANNPDFTEVVLDILRSGKQQFSTDETGSNAEGEPVVQDREDDKKPSERLTEEELAGFKAVGADPKKMDELAEKDPVYAEALASLNRK